MDESLLTSILENIPVAKSKIKQSVLILARYKYYGNLLNLKKINHLRADLVWRFSTIHKAKGAEADYVILIGIKSGKHAFPCEIADDPLLELVLSTKEHFDHAEERRLFYVALTRTKNTIFVVGDSMAESTFFKELMEDPDVDTSHLGHAINRRCPKCQAMMMEKKGDFGPFFGCSNYPICHFSTKPCFSCRIGFLINNEDQMKCDNADCQKIYEICPRCKSGALVERKGKHGLFLGCTNYFTMDECSYSRNVGKLIRKNI